MNPESDECKLKLKSSFLTISIRECKKPAMGGLWYC
jgi:hypothetical protein